MGLRTNTHSTEWANEQIHILQNAPTGKYTFYGMRLQTNTHSTECVSGQIHILQNAPAGKYTFYEIRLQANIHATKCAYGQKYAFYGMRLRAKYCKINSLCKESI